MHEKRKKIWIDRSQTLLSMRIAGYFLLYQVAVWSMVSIEATLRSMMAQIRGDGVTGGFLWIAVAAILVLSVLFIYDAIRFSHRIVGPLVRFRHVCRAIRDNETVPLVQLRQGDLLGDFRDEFNEMLRALEERGAITIHSAKEKPAESAASA